MYPVTCRHLITAKTAGLIFVLRVLSKKILTLMYICSRYEPVMSFQCSLCTLIVSESKIFHEIFNCNILLMFECFLIFIEFLFDFVFPGNLHSIERHFYVASLEMQTVPWWPGRKESFPSYWILSYFPSYFDEITEFPKKLLGRQALSVTQSWTRSQKNLLSSDLRPNFFCLNKFLRS